MLDGIDSGVFHVSPIYTVVKAAFAVDWGASALAQKSLMFEQNRRPSSFKLTIRPQ